MKAFWLRPIAVRWPVGAALLLLALAGPTMAAAKITGTVKLPDGYSLDETTVTVHDANNHLYDYSLATETGSGTLAFTTSRISTVSSDPTTGDRWFARTVNASFPFATAFIGDYSNIAALPTGGVAAYWTDLRETACFGSRCGHGEDGFFATAP